MLVIIIKTEILPAKINLSIYWWISFAPEFQYDFFCESSSLFYLSLNSDFYVSKIMHVWARNLPCKPNN